MTALQVWARDVVIWRKGKDARIGSRAYGKAFNAFVDMRDMLIRQGCTLVTDTLEGWLVLEMLLKSGKVQIRPDDDPITRPGH